MIHNVLFNIRLKATVRRFLPFYLFTLLPLHSAAQQPWTLQQCIDYALEHNISVRQRENMVLQQQVQVANAKSQRLPDLSASAGQNFSFGRGLTSENTYTNTNTSSTSFSLGTSVPIFTGFRIPNSIAVNRLNLQAATAELEKAKNDIRMQVAQEYVQILYYMEISEVAHRQIQIDSVQVARLQALIDNGKASLAELSQQKATLAQSHLTATQADNNTRLALLTLSQLLELPTPENFTVQSLVWKAESGEVPTPDQIFAEALTTRPEIQAEHLRLSAAEKNIDIARSGWYPQLSFSAGLGSNYYRTSGFKADGFAKQLKNNFSQYLGLNLSVPIFDRFSTRNSVRSAKLERENQLLSLDNTKKQLYKEIQQAYFNTVASSEKLKSSEQACESAADAFRLVQAKYENGKSTITEFNESKNNYLRSSSDLTQARYEYLYQQALIRFYRGQPLSF